MMNTYCVHCERCNKIIAVFRSEHRYISDDDGRLLCIECFARIMDDDYKGDD